MGSILLAMLPSGCGWSGAPSPYRTEGEQFTLSIVALAILAFGIAVPLHFAALATYPYFETQKTDLAAIYSEYSEGTHVGSLAVEPSREWPEVLEQNKEVWSSRYNRRCACQQ